MKKQKYHTIAVRKPTKEIYSAILDDARKSFDVGDTISFERSGYVTEITRSEDTPRSPLVTVNIVESHYETVKPAIAMDARFGCAVCGNRFTSTTAAERCFDSHPRKQRKAQGKKRGTR